MNTSMKLALTAAAVLAVAVVGYSLLPRLGSFGAPATPGPTTLVPSTAPSPMALPEDVDVPLAPGTYEARAPFLVRVAATVPAGWSGHVGGEYYADYYIPRRIGGLYLSIFDKVAADPCDSTTGFVTVAGPSAADLATALGNMPGVTVTGLADVTVGRWSGKQLTLTAPATFIGCKLTPDGYAIWQLPLGANFTIGAGAVERLWILDVEDQRLVIDLEPGNLTAAQQAELQAVFASLHIEPAR